MSLHCPNQSCPYATRYRRPAEYREGFTTCSDCGSALVPGESVPIATPIAPEAIPAGPVSRELWQRVTVTAGVLGIAWAASQILIPGVDLSEFDRAGLRNRVFAMAGAASLGLNPAIFAFQLVEWAALIVPPWRHLRAGTPEGRVPLRRAAYLLTAVFGLVQGFGIGTWMQSVHMLEPGLGQRLMVTAILGVTSTLALALAHVAGRRGLGNGFSVLLAAALVPSVVELAESAYGLWTAGAMTSGLPFTLALPSVIVAVASVRLARRFWKRGEGPRGLPLPASGVAPLGIAAGILSLPLSVAPLLGADLREYAALLSSGDLRVDAIHLALIAASCAALSFLFNRPERVSALRARLGVEGAPDPLERSAVKSFLFLALLYAAARVGSLPVSGVRMAVDMVGVAVFAAVAQDLVSEWRFRRVHGPVVSVWPVHQVYAAPALVEALEAREVPALARSLRHRALLQFFGPHVPVEILVPAAHATKAEAALRAVAPPGTPASPQPS